MEQDFYAILQVSPTADQEVIEGSYVRLTHKYHPDLNASPDAVGQMKAINEAYDVLSDPFKRAAYDRERQLRLAVMPDDFTREGRFRNIIQVLEQEQKDGCQDAILLGGLDGYVQQWAQQFADAPRETSTLAASIAAFLAGYRNMSPQERGQALAQALARAKREPVPPYRIQKPPPAPAALPPAMPVAASRRVFAVQPKFIWIGILLAGWIVLGIVAAQAWLPRPSDSAGNAAPAVAPVHATDRCPQGCMTPPPGCQIKGNISSTSGDKVYHVPGDEFYSATIITPATGERWFCLEEEAIANGWRHARK